MPPSVQVQAKKAENQQINTNVQQNQVQNQRNIPQELPQEAAPRERHRVRDPLEYLESELQQLSQEHERLLRDVVAGAQDLKKRKDELDAWKADPTHTEVEIASREEVVNEMAGLFRMMERKLYHTMEELCRKQMEYHQLYARQMHMEETDEIADEAEELGIDKQIAVYERLQREPWGELLRGNTYLNRLRLRKQALQNRQSLRADLSETAKSMAKMAKEYKESGFGEAYDDLKGNELLELYIEKAESIWNDKKLRQEYLSSSFITEHLVQSLSVLDLANKFQNKRGKIRIPRDMRERLQKADQVLAYYRHHVNAVLGDYGMSLDQLTYSSLAIDLIVKGEKRYARKERWEKDYEIYELLEGRKEDMTGVREGNTIQERRLRRLERRAGINLDDETDLINTVYDEEESEQYQEHIERNGTNYIRLKADYQLTNGDNKRRLNKEARLLAVSQSFIWKLKEEGVWDENSEFATLPKLIYDYMESYRTKLEMSYTTFDQDETKFRQKLRKTLDRIVLTGKGFREKQYASLMRQYVGEEEDGRIDMPNMVAQGYRVYDEFFSDMNVEIKDSAKRRCIDTFRPVREEPLFPHEPTLRDLTQGASGDCYFISALASIVARKPSLIKKMMQDNGDGTVTVSFYHDAQQQKTIQVTVDKTIPERDYVNLWLNTDSFSRGALWVKMMEKAYAAVRRGKKVVNPWEINNGERVESGRPSYAYSNLNGGDFSQAIQELTGELPAGKMDIKMETLDVQVFGGRLHAAAVPTLGEKKLDRPSLLYFQKRHMQDKDNKAFRYLAGEGKLPKSSVRTWKEELKRYEYFERTLETILDYREGKMEVRAMDNKTLAVALGRVLADIEQYTKALKSYEGGDLEDGNMKTAKIPEEMWDIMRICWEQCNRNPAEMQRIFLEMGNDFKHRLEKETVPQEYTAKEEQMYRNIQNTLRRGGVCSVGTRDFQSDNLSVSGTVGESYRNGMYGKHAYAVLGTQEIRVGNRVKKFLELFNPHGGSIPVYQVNEAGELKRVPLSKHKEDMGSTYETATHGVFLLELRDARSVMDVLLQSGSL